jgi:hypothetical protein
VIKNMPGGIPLREKSPLASVIAQWPAGEKLMSQVGQTAQTRAPLTG